MAGWHRHWEDGKEWRPYDANRAQNSRKFTDEQEQELLDKLRQTYWESHRMLSSHQFQAEATDTWQQLRSGTRTDLFSASGSFQSGFMHRHGLSQRTPTLHKNIVTPDAERIAQFRREVDEALREVGPKFVVNMDETAWKDIQVGGKTISLKGLKSVAIHVRGDPKAAMSAICTITAAGRKLPPLYILAADSDRCRTALLPAVPETRVTHSHNGWMNEPVMLRYLSWLSEALDGNRITLVMDSFPAHITEAVQLKADELGIRIILVPEGMTGPFQPLDRAGFGALKHISQALWDRRSAQNPFL
jgi:hypothetical protein